MQSPVTLGALLEVHSVFSDNVTFGNSKLVMFCVSKLLAFFACQPLALSTHRIGVSMLALPVSIFCVHPVTHRTILVPGVTHNAISMRSDSTTRATCGAPGVNTCIGDRGGSVTASQI